MTALASSRVCRRIADSVLNRLSPSGTTAIDSSSGYLSSTSAKVSVERRAVVHAGAQHDLAAHGDAVVEQGPQPAQAHPATRVLQHARPQLGLGGVDADVQRRQALGDHPLEIGLGEPGERGEVAVQEAEPVVVVLQVQALPHALGQLVDEAELAVVVAGAHPVEHRAGHLGTQRFAGPLVDRDRLVEAAAAQLDLELGFVDQEPPLDDVAGHLTVERDDLVTCAQACRLGGGTCSDADDHRS